MRGAEGNITCLDVFEEEEETFDVVDVVAEDQTDAMTRSIFRALPDSTFIIDKLCEPEASPAAKNCIVDLHSMRGYLR